MKISHKLFLLNLGTIVLLTASFLALSYHSNQSLLSNAMNGIDKKAMVVLAEKLGQHYAEEDSWDDFIADKNIWSKIVNENFFKVFLAHLPPMPAPPPPTDAAPKKNFVLPFGTFLQRLTLLSPDKQPIIVAEMRKPDVNFQKIKVNGKVVGWLETGKINMDIIPLAEHFFKEQLVISSITALVGALIAMIISFAIAKRISAPINQLVRGARNIAKRDFREHISIDTNDEFKELALSLNAVSQELNRYETLQKQWLMDISHELRTPLTILIGEISAICDNLTQCDISAVASLKEEIMHINRLVSDLHELSTIESSDVNLTKKTIELGEILDHQLVIYKNKFLEKDIQLKFRPLDNDVIIYGDSGRLTQVIRNLLENSLRYTRSPGSLWIYLHVTSNREAMLVVEDSGPGVSTETLAKLFDRLYRTDSSRSRISGGAGLGLTICKKIISLHGGAITADHSEKGGLSICITLPLAAEVKDEQ